MASSSIEPVLQAAVGTAVGHLWALMERVARATAAAQVYEAAMDCLEHALGVDRSAVLLFDDAGVMRFVASRGISARYCGCVEGHTPWAPGTADAAPVIVADVSADSELAAFGELFAAEGIAALTFIPLQFGDILLGKFMLYFARPYAPPAHELAIARAVAGHVAFALDRFRESAARHRHEQAQALLAEAAVSLTASLDYRQTLDTLVHLLVPKLADWCVVHVVGPDGEIHPGELAHADPAREPAVRMLHERWRFRTDDPIGVAQVMRSGQSLLVPRVPPELVAQVAQDPEHHRVMEELAPRSCMMVPLIARKRTLGTITLVAAESPRVFGRHDLALAQELASRAALAIDNARLYQAAQAAVRARDEMVAVVSHDIRSPLQTITTACSILELDVPEPRKAQSRAMIRRAVGQMERLTTDLLDISRIEAGGIPLHCGEVDAAALLVEVGAAFQATADASLIRLEVMVEPGLPRLWADRDRLLQVLSNLLGNAFKFTPQGGRIGLRALRCGVGVQLVVSDTGCGIPPDHVPRLFDRFWQSDRKRGPGAGLGLAIVKGLVEGHGGVVEVESTVGVGSTFSVSLPIRSPAPTRTHDDLRREDDVSLGLALQKARSPAGTVTREPERGVVASYWAAPPGEGTGPEASGVGRRP